MRQLGPTGFASSCSGQQHVGLISARLSKPCRARRRREMFAASRVGVAHRRPHRAVDRSAREGENAHSTVEKLPCTERSTASASTAHPSFKCAQRRGHVSLPQWMTSRCEARARTIKRRVRRRIGAASILARALETPGPRSGQRARRSKRVREAHAMSRSTAKPIAHATPAPQIGRGHGEGHGDREAHVYREGRCPSLGFKIRNA